MPGALDQALSTAWPITATVLFPPAHHLRGGVHPGSELKQLDEDGLLV